MNFYQMITKERQERIENLEITIEVVENKEDPSQFSWYIRASDEVLFDEHVQNCLMEKLLNDVNKMQIRGTFKKYMGENDFFNKWLAVQGNRLGKVLKEEFMQGRARFLDESVLPEDLN